jgi:hypothetical protein
VRSREEKPMGTELQRRNLLQIAEEFSAVIEADENEAGELGAIAGDLEYKCGNIAGLLRYLDDQAGNLERWAADIQAEAKALRNKHGRLKAWLHAGLETAGVWSLSWGPWKVSLQKNPEKLEIVDEGAIPAEYWVVPEPPPAKVDRRQALADLKAGKPVPGCRIADPTTHVRTSLKGGSPS